jgi:hypothetical protein
MIAASTYSPSATCSTIAASSIHGTGAQNLPSAIRNGFKVVSGAALGPNCLSRRPASSLVRPVWVFTESDADAPSELFPVDGVESGV